MGRWAPRLLSALVLAALRPPGSALADAPADPLETHGCHHCHTSPLASALQPDGCVGCHRRLLTRGSARAMAAHVVHYVDVPSLEGAVARLRPEYVERYLLDPHDARPRLEETMPRLALTEGDARAITSLLYREARRAVPSTPAPRAELVPLGRAVFAAQCLGCHDFGNWTCATAEDASFVAAPAALRLAPNLRFVRDRMDPDVVLAWIRDPAALDPAAHMPALPLSDAERLAVRDFLFLASPGAPAPARAAPDLRSLAESPGPVGFADVRRVFGASCIHCHAHATRGDAAAGLGFAPIALDLSTYEGVMRGTLGPDGRRRSVVRATGDGPAPLLARLLRRHEEAARDVVPPGRDALGPAVRVDGGGGPRGMPLGLPPLGEEDLRVVAAWLAAGAPR